MCAVHVSQTPDKDFNDRRKANPTNVTADFRKAPRKDNSGKWRLFHALISCGAERTKLPPNTAPYGTRIYASLELVEGVCQKLVNKRN